MADQPFWARCSENPAENYERFFVPAIGAPLARELVRAAALLDGERVLDVACGTGVVARLAWAQVGGNGSVAGLDVNPGMLAVARSTTPVAGAIDWHEASAQAMPLADGSFDVVLCQMGLQFMSDAYAALTEMRRVLAPGGRLLLNLPGPAPRLFTIIEDELARTIGAEAAGFVAQVFSLHDTAEIEGLLRGAGFPEVSVEAGTMRLHLPPPRAFFWQYVLSTPLAGPLGTVDEQSRAGLERAIAERWRPFVREEGLALDLRVVLATGRR